MKSKHLADLPDPQERREALDLELTLHELFPPSRLFNSMEAYHLYKDVEKFPKVRGLLSLLVPSLLTSVSDHSVPRPMSSMPWYA